MGSFGVSVGANGDSDSEESFSDSVSEMGSFKVSDGPSRDSRDSFLELVGSFLELADSFLELAESFLELAESFLELVDSFLEPVDSFLELVDSFLELEDSFLELKDSFLDKVSMSATTASDDSIKDSVDWFWDLFSDSESEMGSFRVSVGSASDSFLELEDSFLELEDSFLELEDSFLERVSMSATTASVDSL